MIELRSRARYLRKVDVVLAVAGGAEHRCSTRDISLGGLFAEAPVDLPVGTTVDVRFKVGTLREELRAPATVRWIQRDGVNVLGVGLRIDGLGAVQQWGLNRYFAQVAE